MADLRSVDERGPLGSSEGGYGGGGGPATPVTLTVEKLEKYAYNSFLREKAVAPATKLFCLIIGHHSHPIIKSEIIPKFGYFNQRSRNNVDFLCIGFFPDGPVTDREFVATIEALERETDWKYSGVTELLVLSVSFRPELEKATLDFFSTVVLPLEKLIDRENIASASEIIEGIIHHSKELKSSDPIWTYSDKVGGRAVRKSFFDLIIGFLPQSLRATAKTTAYFAVKDLRKRHNKRKR